MKNLPLSELSVVSVLYCAGNDEDGRVDFEEDVLDQVLLDASRFEPFSKKCDCCGQHLKYACRVVHVPTKAGYYVGRSCASKIEVLQRFTGRIDGASVALAERAACNARENAFRAAAPAGVLQALDWAKSAQASKLAEEFVTKLRRWGNLSAAQVACLERMHKQHQDKLAIAATGVRCPSGRVDLQGRVASLKNDPQPERFGRGTVDRWKMVLDLGNGVRVWGTCPAGLAPTGVAPAPRAMVGCTVRLSATVKPSDRDSLFGYFSRPTKSAIIGHDQVPAQITINARDSVRTAGELVAQGA